MAELWIPGFQVHQFDDRTGGLYDRLEPKKVLLHTTEGTSVVGAMGAYARYPPHIIANYATMERVQHISLDRRAYALKGTESEDEPVIQVEIVGFAEQSHNWSPEALQWLAVNVLAPIHRLWPYKLQGPPQGFHGSQDGIVPYLATKESPIRFSPAEFEAFGGVCGHQHAPSPDNHWDPGKLDIDTLLGFLADELESDQPAPDEGDWAGLEARVYWLELRQKVIGNTMHLADSPFDFVVALYRGVLRQEPEDTDLLHWIDELASSRLTPLQVIDEFLEAASNGAAGPTT